MHPQEFQVLKERVASLEEELRVIRIKEKSNEDKIKSLEKEIQDLKVKIEKLENENESLFIIVEIGKTTQRNMCEYVLGKYFENWPNYKFKKINNYIGRFVPVPEQESAKKRLEELKEKISWDEDLVDSLKHFNQTRNVRAHPKLNSENIQQAIEFLREKGELNDKEVNNLTILKEQWETSVALLQRSSAEGKDQGGPRNVPATRQKHATYTRNTAGELVNPRPPKRARKGQTSSAEGRDQGTVPTTRQKNGTYASKASSERANTPPSKWKWVHGTVH